MKDKDYFPLAEHDGGWRVSAPSDLGVDPAQLKHAINIHDHDEVFTKSYGGALVIVYKGHIIGESYVTGIDGGPQPWTASTCNDMKSSTKSIFGTAVGVFLEEFKKKITLDTLLVGNGLKDSLIPQIWSQLLTD